MLHETTKLKRKVVCSMRSLRSRCLRLLVQSSFYLDRAVVLASLSKRPACERFSDVRGISAPSVFPSAKLRRVSDCYFYRPFSHSHKTLQYQHISVNEQVFSPKSDGILVALRCRARPTNALAVLKQRQLVRSKETDLI